MTSSFLFFFLLCLFLSVLGYAGLRNDRDLFPNWASQDGFIFFMQLLGSARLGTAMNDDL